MPANPEPSPCESGCMSSSALNRGPLFLAAGACEGAGAGPPLARSSAVRPGAEAWGCGAGRRNRRAREAAHWRGGTRRGRTRLGGSGTRRRGRRRCGRGRARRHRGRARFDRGRRWRGDDGGLGRLDHGHGLPDIATFGAAHLPPRRRDHRRRLEARIAGRTDNDRHCLEPPRAGFTWCKPAHAFAQFH